MENKSCENCFGTTNDCKGCVNYDHWKPQTLTNDMIRVKIYSFTLRTIGEGDEKYYDSVCIDPNQPALQDYIRARALEMVEIDEDNLHKESEE